MKNIKLIILLFFVFNLSLAQTKKDLTEIVELIVSECSYNEKVVFKKFDNDLLLSNLKDSFLSNISKKESYTDNLFVEFENLKINISSAIKLVKKKNNKPIRSYTKIKLKNNKSKPITYISFPLISNDNKKAVVYSSYICGTLCGNGGVFFLEKTNGKWEIIKYKERWIS